MEHRQIIEAALVTFERQRQELDETIAELKAQLGGTSNGRGRKAKMAGATKTKRVLSASARKRIAAAQKARWAAFHAKQGAPAKKAAPAKKTAQKRKMSPERKAALVANLAKARAAKAKKAAA
jgi:DNA-binding protein HU-beta